MWVPFEIRTSCPFLAVTSGPSAICQPYIFSRHCDCPTFILSQFRVIQNMYFCCNTFPRHPNIRLWQIAVSRIIESEFHSRSDSVLQIAQREIISVMGIRCLSLHYQHHNLLLLLLLIIILNKPPNYMKRRRIRLLLILLLLLLLLIFRVRIMAKQLQNSLKFM